MRQILVLVHNCSPDCNDRVIYNFATQMVTIRAGLIWDDVYAGLDLYEVNVVGTWG